MPTNSVEKVRDFMSQDPRRRIILALDHMRLHEMMFVDREIMSKVGAVKIGNELHSRHGWAVISRFLATKRRVQGVYYDSRFSDNPDQMGAVMDVFNSTNKDDSIQPGIISLDALASSDEALKTAVSRRGKFLLITETVQPSLDEADCYRRHGRTISDAVYDTALIASEAGLQGITSSVEGLSKTVDDTALSGLLKIVTGIRSKGDRAGDQKIIATPYDAIRRGAEALVIGRSIFDSGEEGQVSAMNRIASEIEKALD